MHFLDSSTIRALSDIFVVTVKKTYKHKKKHSTSCLSLGRLILMNTSSSRVVRLHHPSVRSTNFGKIFSKSPTLSKISISSFGERETSTESTTGKLKLPLPPLDTDLHSWHADIKPDNILRVRNKFKLADPGFANFERSDAFKELKGRQDNAATFIKGGTLTFGQ